MSDFQIPKSALRRGAGQIQLDGTEEQTEFVETLGVFTEPPREGEAGVIADLNALARAGWGRWVRT